MQLFSIGLWELNQDGSYKLDANSNKIATYTNLEIMAFAKVWTGYTKAPLRSNIQAHSESEWLSENMIDPMVLRAYYRDVTPKISLRNGYLGDFYPLCAALPEKHFLMRGATYKFTGTSSVLGAEFDDTEYLAGTVPPAFVLPCANPNGNGKIVDCPEDASEAAAQQPTFTISGVATEISQATKSYNRFAIRFPIEPTVVIYGSNRDLRLQMTNDRTGDTLIIAGVHHWAWTGNNFYVFLEQGITLAEVNAMFLVGDTLSFAHARYPNIRQHFVPSVADSALFAALCEADSGSGECTFPSTVVLADTLACNGNVECNADTLHAIKLVDPITSTVVYYEYTDPPCVRLAFFDDGQATQYAWEKQCTNPAVAGITGVACCSNVTKAVLSNGGDECLYIAEATTYTTAQERCAALHTNGDDVGVVCPAFNHHGNPTGEPGASFAFQAGCSGYQYHWTNQPCELKAQIDASGYVNIIDETAEGIRDDLQPGAGNPFPVRWNAPIGGPELTDGAQFPLMTATLKTPFEITPKFQLVASNIQCKTSDGQVLLGDAVQEAKECALLCGKHKGCAYFIFGNPMGSADGQCYMEAVDSDDCGTDGFEADEYGLYKVQGGKARRGISGSIGLSVNTCTAGCTPRRAQAACICPIEVQSRAVYTDATAALPTPAVLRATLKLGALNPAKYGSGVYTQCDAAACSSQPGVAVYIAGSSSTPAEYDEHTIFEITDAPVGEYGQKRVRFLLNMISTVFVGNRTLGFNFRNPPSFLPNAGEETRGHGSWNSERSPYGHTERKLPHAQYETEALLNHLHEHDNTAPFVAYRLIQRITSSNPSPRYINVVADAFAEGKYKDIVFSGTYGDLKAAVTALLLDREARSATLDIDPTHGMIREPLLKVLHMMRSMAFKPNGKLEVMLHDIHLSVGQNGQ